MANPQNMIRAQLIVIIGVFVAQGQTIDPLRHQFLHRVFDPLRIAAVAKAGCELAEDPGALLHLPQQHSTAVTGDGSPVELGPYLKLQSEILLLARP